jgi:calcium-dependent protein kinase
MGVVGEPPSVYSENSENYEAEQVEELLAVMDKNKSGKIDFNEFITAMCDRRLLFQRQALEDAFDYFDRDKSGEISRQELEEILEGVQNEEIEYLFSELDKNQDRKISRKEFIVYLSKYESE